MSATLVAGEVGFGTPFQAQIDFLRQKLRVPSERWDDIQGRAHDRAFMVAGAAKADLLADLHQSIIDRATDGQGLRAFQKDFKAIVAKHGWTGWTGEDGKEGVAWRTRVIYQTNMATSYAAGRYAQMTDPEVLKLHPYWRYLHSDGLLHPRPQHLAWHGLTLLASHPFWKTHYTPCGWGCQCRVTSVTRKEGEASARAGLGQPPEGWDAINPATGAQVGIDKGWNYAPGASLTDELRNMVTAKASKLPSALAKALTNDVEQVLGKSIDDYIQAGRVISESLPQPDGLQGAAQCHAALLELLQKEVGISAPCMVASSGEGARLVRKASQQYPNTWTQKADALGPLYARASADTRGFHYTESTSVAVRLPGFGTVRNVLPGTGWIETRTGDVGNAVHEYAHRLQTALPELDDLFQQLHRRRTDGDPLERLADVSPGRGYGPKELTRKDGYRNAYQGREYAHLSKNPALEVMTMAFEDVLGLAHFSPKRLADFESLYKNDREMFDFVVGLLRWWEP